MWDWLKELLEIIGRHGVPLVTTALFLIFLPLAVGKLWREYRHLLKKNNDLLIETMRLMEIASLESEIAGQVIKS